MTSRSTGDLLIRKFYTCIIMNAYMYLFYTQRHSSRARARRTKVRTVGVQCGSVGVLRPGVSSGEPATEPISTLSTGKLLRAAAIGLSTVV
eukprot:COSAG02_NODE_13904_length_1332_cov_1.652879_1_plen_90_part_10